MFNQDLFNSLNQAIDQTARDQTARDQTALDQSAMPLVQALYSATQQAEVPFYTPGHKHGRGATARLRDWWGDRLFRADLPELPELDNLFAPQAAIYAAQTLAAAAFGADRTWFLINGSTCGVVAAILATCNPGDKLILPRNCHQSAIAGLILSGALPVFVQPDYDTTQDLAHCLTPEHVTAALSAHPDAKAILLVSPTYYGTCGDVGAIARIAHQAQVPLLVDEAHGAHFAFHRDLPPPALRAGADLVVQSIHKTLSALTQAAMLHLRSDRICPQRVGRSLQLLQSTSPSYLLLASLDAARQQMATQGASLLGRTLDLADAARQQLQQIAGLTTLNPAAATRPGFVHLDRTRLTLHLADWGLDGFTADAWLREQAGVSAELPTWRHLTFIFSLGNQPADVDRLVSACRELAIASPPSAVPPPPVTWAIAPVLPLAELSPRDACFAPSERVPFAQAVDRISTELLCPYPPGIPVLVPGERVTPSAIAQLQQVRAAGGSISGAADPDLATMAVVA